jgi:hypothetical protein
MPPRFAYWTILIDDNPTAFRAREAEELLPTLNQLKRKNSNVVMKWFSGGQLWSSPEAARDARKRPPPAAEKRGAAWRPGGKHEDPRERFKKRSHERSKQETGTRGGEDNRPSWRDKSSPPPGARPWSGKPSRPPRSDRPWNSKPSGPPRSDRPWTGKPSGPPRSDRPWSGKPSGPPRGDRPWSGKPSGPPRGDRPWNSKPSGPPRGDRPWNSKPSGPPRGDRPWNSKPSGPPRGDRPWSGKPPGGAPPGDRKPWGKRPPGKHGSDRGWTAKPGPRFDAGAKAGGPPSRPWTDRPPTSNRKPYPRRDGPPRSAPLSNERRRRDDEPPDRD